MGYNRAELTQADLTRGRVDPHSFYTLQVLIFRKASTFDRFSYGNTSLLPIVS